MAAASYWTAVAGRYRISATLELSEPDEPGVVAFKQVTVAELDVLPPAAGATGGTCPPDP